MSRQVIYPDSYMIETWLEVKHYPLLFERDPIEGATVGKLR